MVKKQYIFIYIYIIYNAPTGGGVVAAKPIPFQNRNPTQTIFYESKEVIIANLSLFRTPNPEKDRRCGGGH